MTTDMPDSCGHGQNSASIALAVDPVCKMSVDPANAQASLVWKETTFYFCCSGCKQKFASNPDQYLSVPACCQQKPLATKSASVEISDLYTCPMHPEVESVVPADCYLCGMPLTPASAQLNHHDELKEVTTRLKISVVLTLLLILLAVPNMTMGQMSHKFVTYHLLSYWLQFVLCIPLVAWVARPFFRRGLDSLFNRHLNMYTLLSMGIGIPFLYSAILLIDTTFGNPSQGGMLSLYFDSAAVIITLSWLGQFLELKARVRSTDDLRALLNLVPASCLVIADDGKDVEMPVSELKPGMRVRIRSGQRIPADGSVISGTSTVDESMLTGESMPVTKQTDAILSAGTINQNGTLAMIVHSVGDQTRLAQIARMVSEAQRSRVPIQQLADRAASIFVPLVVVVGVSAFVYWLWAGAGLATATTIATAVFVVACPCALGLATPMSIVVATGRAAKAGVLFREARSLQAVSKVDTVVVDKTGTLTCGKPKLIQMEVADGFQRNQVLALLASASVGSHHPLSKAIVEQAADLGLPLDEGTEFVTVPGYGIKASVSGRKLISGTSAFLSENGIVVNNVQVAGTNILVAIDGKYAACMHFADSVRESAKQVVARLKSYGIDVVMASGDNEQAVKPVATALGIKDFYWETTPEGKANLVNRLKHAGKIVAMIGDGINDAPALAVADVGIAVSDGVDIAINTADIVLLHGDLNGLIVARQVSSAMMQNIKQNLGLAFAYNAVAVPLAAGVLIPVAGVLLNPMVAAAAMSVSSVAVVLNALRLQKLPL